MNLARKISFVVVTMLFLVMGLSAQEVNQTAGPSSSGIISTMKYVPSLAQQIEDGTFIPHKERPEPVIFNPKKRWSNKAIPGKGLPKGGDPLVQRQADATTYPGRDPLLVFHADQNSNSTPTDPTCAVGPNHFIGAWNTGFRIYDKSGNALVGEAALGTVLTGNNTGDPIVLYDHEADRFIITEFDSNPNGFEIAVCEGPDPVNDGWYVYTNQFTTGSFPDYTKFSIWSDAYYVTANIGGGGGSGTGDAVWAVERSKLLVGADAQYVGFPLPGISTSGFYSPQVFNVTGGPMPPEGNATVVYLQDDAWGGVNTDHLKLWDVNVDWSTLSNSTISAATQITTAPFTSVFDGGSFSNFSQPTGPDVDGLQATIMNQAQFRQFGTYNSAIFNFVVDADASGGETGAVRWYELRQDAGGDPWTIFQEGTYVSPTGDKDAFGASMAMDEQGNIGMAYTTVSSSESVAIYYTGRYASDPAGVMSVDETLIAQGSSNNPSNRLADYTHCVLDPADGKSFWHIAEYFDPGRDDVVGVFKLAPDFIADVGVVAIPSPSDGSLGAAETVTVSIRNFGVADQSDFPVSFSVDGGTPITEMYTGVIPSATTVDYTFTATADLSTIGSTYDIMASTGLSGDEDATNDPFSKDVLHLSPIDVGVVAISNPTSGAVGASEIVTIVIENFGGAEQTSIPVSYSVDGGTPVQETFTGSLQVGNTLNYSFTTPVMLAPYSTVTITASTEAVDDADTSNDPFSAEITAINCIPTAVGTDPTNGCTSDGFRFFGLGTINNSSGCEEDYGVLGYGDFTDLSTDLDLIEPNPDVTVESGYAPETVVIWIDFNDNGLFETSERVLDPIDITVADVQQTFQLTLDPTSALGEHILRARASDEPNNGEDPITDPCGDLTWGETEDYTVNIVTTISVDEVFGEDAELQIIETSDNMFQVNMNTNFDGVMVIKVVDPLGKTVVSNRVARNGNGYSYDLDMTHASSGVYLIRMGDNRLGKVKRVVVK